MRRRRTDAFGLSFLDCICCGFGAVILFYVMMSAQGGVKLAHRSDDLKAQVDRLEERVLTGTRNLAALRNSLQTVQGESSGAAAQVASVAVELKERSLQLSTFDADSVARKERIEQLQADIRALQESRQRLEGGSLDRTLPGQDVQDLPGAGEPRYITGLTLRGKHVLILIDRSASMLHEDLVSVIRLRNTDDATKCAAAKWRRAIEIVSWLTTQLPSGSKYQIYAFNTAAEPLITGSAGAWLDGGDAPAFARNLAALHALVPRDGTSLINAFSAARALKPQPDQIVLITDGLPTQGRSVGARKYIDAGARAHLLDEAIAVLPPGVPTDIVLLPMKGEVEAAHRFWTLARQTRGTLLSPAKDWP